MGSTSTRPLSCRRSIASITSGCSSGEETVAVIRIGARPVVAVLPDRPKVSALRLERVHVLGDALVRDLPSERFGVEELLLRGVQLDDLRRLKLLDEQHVLVR